MKIQGSNHSEGNKTIQRVNYFLNEYKAITLFLHKVEI